MVFPIIYSSRLTLHIQRMWASIRASQLATQPNWENNVRHWRNWDFGSYFNDDWKVSKRLSLNLGLRYDLYTRSTELNHLSTTFIRGPGRQFIDNISTGAGQIKDASAPCPGNPLATLAGECGFYG